MMESNGFSAGICIKKGWKLMRENLKYFIAFFAIYILTILLTGPLPQSYQEELGPYWFALTSVASIILPLILWCGLIQFSLSLADGKEGKVGNFFPQWKHCLLFFLASILYFLLFTFGLLLFIIPGIIWGCRYALFPFLVIEKGMGPIKSFKESAKLTYGYKWDVFFILVAGILINVLGAFCLLIGLVATLPTTLIAKAVMYKLLLSKLPQESAQT
jgi:hypothetical protein